MSQDCAIKLFGKTISVLPDEKLLSNITVAQQTLLHSSSAESTLHDYTKDASSDNRHVYEESVNPSESTTTSSDVEPTTLKKPDKLLPCPRCKSTDTKFCYYNNYNVKQPRHFCKKCQRYWTSGGTMRNVPVGSGRRKNKNAGPAPNNSHRLTFLEAQPEPAGGFLIFGPHDEHLGRALGPTGFPLSFYPAYWGPIPKTLRIDDPNKAAERSVWTTLGVKNEKLVGSGGKKMRLFEAVETKGDRNRSVDNTTTMASFYANPAALSRSFNFHESAQ